MYVVYYSSTDILVHTSILSPAINSRVNVRVGLYTYSSSRAVDANKGEPRLDFCAKPLVCVTRSTRQALVSDQTRRVLCIIYTNE